MQQRQGRIRGQNQLLGRHDRLPPFSPGRDGRRLLQRLMTESQPLIAALPLSRKVKWTVDVDPIDG